MEGLLQNPAVQSAGVPLFLALVTALALARTQLAPLGVVLGILACAWLTVGLDVFPLTSTRRTLLALVVLALAGFVLDALKVGGQRWIPVVVGAVAALFAVYPALLNASLMSAAVGTAVAVFTGAAVLSGLDHLRSRPVAGAAAGVGTAVTTGFMCVLGASASLGQLAIAAAAASGGFALVALVGKRTLPGGRLLVWPLGVLIALAAVAGVVLAQVPWMAMPFVALAPWVAGWLPVPGSNRWLEMTLRTVAATAVGLVGVWATWYATGASSASASGY